MQKCYHWPIGVCSWSVQSDISGIADAMRQVDLEHIHLALRPALQEDGVEYLEAVGRQDWTITCGMIDFPQEDYSTLDAIKETGGVTPDEHWPDNKKMVIQAVDIAADLEVKYLSFHAGFLDHSQPDHAKKFYDRVGVLADAAQFHGIVLLMETGQESAEDLRQFLEEINHPALGVNFDPANMILYDKGDPIDALNTLAPWIKHIHVKDANRTQKPGAWGAEVPWSTGQVQAETFLLSLAKIGYQGALAIEREAGEQRIEDIKFAAEKLAQIKI